MQQATLFFARGCPPPKNDVRGGIVSLAPGQYGFCVWSPALEYSGNSYAGSIDQEMLTTLKGPMMF